MAYLFTEYCLYACLTGKQREKGKVEGELLRTLALVLVFFLVVPDCFSVIVF